MDTVFALATATGKSGVAIIRISGPLAKIEAERFVGEIKQARQTTLRFLRDDCGDIIDNTMVIFFNEGASFTGEDVVELHLHGSPAITKKVLSMLGDRPNLRLAEAGEFTRRALENDCLDLSQVEGLADLIDAETEMQRRQAIQVFNGALGEKIEGWKSDLIKAVALMETTIDFVDEEVPETVTEEVNLLIDRVKSSLEKQKEGSHTAERIRDGFEVAIVGRPNAGKSTLLNALAGRDAAIISEFEGTTRDVIEVRMDLNGIPVTVLDTAGLRETENEVEKIGIDRAIQRAKDADMRVFLLDQQGMIEGISKTTNDIIVFGKSDIQTSDGFSISGKTGEGIDLLVNKISDFLGTKTSESSLIIRERHRISIQTAIESLNEASRLMSFDTDVTELIAQEIWSSIRSLDSILGKIDIENILDEIFSSFCIGK